jgi:hypothetical protein
VIAGQLLKNPSQLAPMYVVVGVVCRGMLTLQKIFVHRGIARVGHTQSNASGVGTSTLIGVSLLEQVLTMNEESPDFTTK